jgi:hypothetical protein
MKSLVGLGMGLKVRKTSGENEVLLENLEADVWSQDRMYGLEPGCTIQSVTGNLIFTRPSHSSYFPYSRIV